MLPGMWFIILISCVTTSPSAVEVPENVKAPGNLPVMTETELSEAEGGLEDCIASCVKDNQMRAVSPQEIRVDCEQECNESHSVRQVEVIPDGPPEQPDEPEDAADSP